MLKKPLNWVARMGQLLAGLVEVSAPGSWAHLFVFHWLSLFYVFGMATFVVGFVLGRPDLQRWALGALLITLAINLLLWMFRAVVTDRRWWMILLGIIIVGFLTGVGVLAWQELSDLGRQHPTLPFFGQSAGSSPVPTLSPSP